MAALALGYLTTVQTLGFAVSQRDPARGYAIAPQDGRVAARYSEALSVGAAGTTEQARSAGMARTALVNEPLAAEAVTVLALDAALNNDRAAAQRLFSHSNRLTRRELPTRLWLIQDAVERNAVPEVIHHYDIALRTSRQASEILFPILAAAVGDPEIARPLAAMLAKRPSWDKAFIDYLATSGPDPIASAQFYRLLERRSVAVPETARARIIDTLTAAGRFNAAWDYYRSTHKGADRRQSRDPEFSSQTELATAFDWKPVLSNPGATADIRPARGGGVFDFAMPSTVGGTVLEQLQLLPVGRYRIEGLTTGIDQLEGTHPFWQLVCPDERELGRVELTNSTLNGGRFAGQFTVPADCPVQRLRLVTRPSSQISGVTGQIERVLLRPVEDR
jgi:hypothetical protein